MIMTDTTHLRAGFVGVVPSKRRNMIGQTEVHELVVCWVEFNHINAIAKAVVRLVHRRVLVGLQSTWNGWNPAC